MLGMKRLICGEIISITMHTIVTKSGKPRFIMSVISRELKEEVKSSLVALAPEQCDIMIQLKQWF